MSPGASPGWDLPNPMPPHWASSGMGRGAWLPWGAGGGAAGGRPRVDSFGGTTDSGAGGRGAGGGAPAEGERMPGGTGAVNGRAPAEGGRIPGGTSPRGVAGRGGTAVGSGETRGSDQSVAVSMSQDSSGAGAASVGDWGTGAGTVSAVAVT